MIVRKKDLRTGDPVWKAYRIPRIPHKTLSFRQKCDVVVIGTGISGAMIAEELSNHGLSVIMLDRRKPCHGSTMASTALLQYEIDEPLIFLSKKIGAEKAQRAWRRSKLGLESLAGKIKLLGIECAFERRPSLYLSGSLMDAAMLKKEQEARQLIGLPTGYLTASQLKREFRFSHRAALLTYDAISVNPVQLTAGFLQAAIKNGTKIYAPVEATDIDIKKHHITIETSTGYSLTAKHVVFATGYEIPRAAPVSDHRIHSTWAFATKPQPRKIWPQSAFIWEASENYLYIKPTEDGRIICGGEDEDFSDAEKRNAMIEKKICVLRRKVKKLFPQLDTTPEYSWAGSFGASKTGLPLIGRLPRKRNCYAALAYGGNGITYSRIAAEILCAQILGKSDPDEDLFSF
jgi:glycine/D-amino acid oxidase-like deaminating enzyme